MSVFSFFSRSNTHRCRIVTPMSPLHHKWSDSSHAVILLHRQGIYVKSYLGRLLLCESRPVFFHSLGEAIVDGVHSHGTVFSLSGALFQLVFSTYVETLRYDTSEKPYPPHPRHHHRREYGMSCNNESSMLL